MASASDVDVELFVPGRICLFGEHSDWAGGYRRYSKSIPVGACIVSGTNQGLHARVHKHAGMLVITSSSHTGERHGPFEMPMEANALFAVAQSGSYWSYAAGVAYVVLNRYKVGGLVVDNYETTLPAEKGLSSSAALCVLLARAFSEVYGLKLSVKGEMELAYLGETTTPSQCGRMDQCCAFGQQPVLMEFDGDRVTSRTMQLGGDIHLVIAELRATKDTTRILRDLQLCYPKPDSTVRKNVHWLLGDYNRRVISKAVAFMEAGDAQGLGELMSEAQLEFDRCATPASPLELTSPVLHRVLAHNKLRPHMWGGKGVGSQGDGCAQLLAKSAEDAEMIILILKEDYGLDCLKLCIRPDYLPDSIPDSLPASHLPDSILDSLDSLSDSFPDKQNGAAAAPISVAAEAAMAERPTVRDEAVFKPRPDGSTGIYAQLDKTLTGQL